MVTLAASPGNKRGVGRRSRPRPSACVGDHRPGARGFDRRTHRERRRVHHRGRCIQVRLVVAAVLDCSLLSREGDWRAQAATLALGLGGFVNLVTLGTLQRIGAVLAWFQRFYESAKTLQVPTAWDLANPWLAWSALPLQAGAAGILALGLWKGEAGLIQMGGGLGCLAQLSAMALAFGCLTRGKAAPFPDGVNPFEEWAREQQ